MFGLGFSEIVVLAVLGLILLGPEQLPDMARALGRFINDLKRTTDDLTQEFKKQGFHDTQSLLEDIRKETTIEPPNFEVTTPPEPTVDSTPEKNQLETKDEHGKKPESH